MKVSFQNNALHEFGADLDSIYQSYAEAGIEAVDFSFFLFNEKHGFSDAVFAMPKEDFEKEYITPQVNAMKRHGITVAQTHAPFPVALKGKDSFNAYTLDAIKKCIYFTKCLGCDKIVVHPYHEATKVGSAEQRKINIAFYTELIPDAKKYGVKILTENMWVTRGSICDSACGDPYEAVDYIDTMNKIAGEELFGFCFDVGHATLCGHNLRNTLDVLGSRVMALHIHDASKIADLHVMPYTQCNNSGTAPSTDWKGFIEGLRDIGYKGDINFEADRSLLVFPKDTHPAVLRLYRAIADHFISELNAENFS